MMVLQQVRIYPFVIWHRHNVFPKEVGKGFGMDLVDNEITAIEYDSHNGVD